jgi:hypothetical protein
MSTPDMGERIARRLAETMPEREWTAMFSPDGLARTAQWHAEDDWIVEYTTSRVRHGRYDGYFCVFVFQPQGKGSRAGKRGSASQWKRVKVERCSTRREAKERALSHFYAHSPRLAAKHGRAG